MSGHKRTTVTISQEEYRRLYDAERKNYYQTFELPEETLFPIVRDSQSKLVENYHQIADRQDRYQQILDSFQDQVREVESSAAQSLVEQQVEFHNQLLSTSEQLWQDTNYVIQKQSQDFEYTVQSQHDRLLDQVANIQHEFSSFLSNQKNKQTIAENWLHDSIQLLDFIQSTYPQELIDSNYLSSNHQQLEFSSINFENGFMEASLSLSQQAFSNLSTYRMQLEFDFAKFQAIYQSIHDQLALVKEQCLTNQSVQAIDANGEYLDQYIDIDYWHNNQNTELVTMIDHLLDQLDGQGNWCNQRYLDQMQSHEIPALMDRYAENVREARRNALNAQLRYNTAQLVMVSLINQGYKPDFGQFEEDDLRNGYFAVAKGADGSSITIKVDPSSDLTSELQLISNHNKLITESEMKHRSIEIMQSLETYGLKIGNIEEVSSPLKKPARLLKSEHNKQKVGVRR